MSLSRHALLAALIALGALVSGLVVWTNGAVDLGLRLGQVDGVVRVVDVTPDGVAARSYVQPGELVLEIVTIDGRRIEGGPQRRLVTEGAYGPATQTVRLPGEPVDEPWIGSLRLAWEEDIDGSAVLYESNALDRAEGLARLDGSIWLVGLGLVLAAGVWIALRLGLAGDVGRREAPVLAAVTATPFAMMPVVYAGTVGGIAAGYLVPAAGALVAASALARHIPERPWQRAGLIAAVVVTALTVIAVVRFLSSAWLSDDRFQVLALTAGIALVPAIIGGLMADGFRRRAAFLSIGLLPGAAVTVLGPSDVNLLPFWLVVGLLAWQLLPVRRIAESVTGAAQWATSAPAGGAVLPAPDPHMTARRDMVAYAVGGLAVVMSAAESSSWALIIGLAVGAGAAYALRRGLLGSVWTDAAVPIGVALAIPIAINGFVYFGDRSDRVVILALGALIVAHLIAWHHPDPGWRGRHFGAAAVIAGFAIYQAGREWGVGALPVVALIPLIPAVSLAFGTQLSGALAMTGRLETLVVGLTPAVAILAATGGEMILVVLVWLGMVLVWRRFTLAPLLGFAQRTQQQLDLAVAAAEQERARLAADLHDDALQELTGLVRRLDEAGDAEGAEMARHVAERLRGITSDLRLPLLDDLGAGAALEWLVARVRPMAGGEVRLERVDPSRPPSAVELAVFRVAQEALANAVKHGKAPITVRYHVDEAGHVSLTVDDAGPGIDPKAAEAALAEGHLGVANMQQRAEQIGALLNIRAWPSGGTHVGLEWRPQ
ncbi:MAG TPA: ATP-binding protein [Candidatus Limnocylindria bacterium]|nr:ATP-binding protein [Candidatus Limnocylindria bacterium]